MTSEDTEEVRQIVKDACKDQQAQDNSLVFQELCATARHYSGLRFAMFTVSTTILGALLALELRPYGSPAPAALPQSFILYFRIGSLVFASLFLLLQWRASDLIVFYQEKAANFSEHLKLPNEENHPFWKNMARIIMITPFLLAAFFWVWQIYNDSGWLR